MSKYLVNFTVLSYLLQRFYIYQHQLLVLKQKELFMFCLEMTNLAEVLHQYFYQWPT